jgi:hypothetical protein
MWSSPADINAEEFILLDAAIHSWVRLAYLVRLSLGTSACWVRWQPGQFPQRVDSVAIDGHGNGFTLCASCGNSAPAEGPPGATPLLNTLGERQLSVV